MQFTFNQSIRPLVSLVPDHYDGGLFTPIVDSKGFQSLTFFYSFGELQNDVEIFLYDSDTLEDDDFVLVPDDLVYGNSNFLPKDVFTDRCHWYGYFGKKRYVRTYFYGKGFVSSTAILSDADTNPASTDYLVQLPNV